ncbi:helix-turn-helix transcriptional regulator [Companilactobacillus jidongensis]|uniref:helix-turn-helix transcriptional regulator n=1 Tax=Companilactobacillus jidongensis TaxID=2486006 RepID=UPI000F7681C7|nr:WYL domain-containing protein [Companilactobacillus jidongensis]
MSVNDRVASMFIRMIQGETLYRDEEASRYSRTPDTIQRDMKSIREYIEDSGTNVNFVRKVDPARYYIIKNTDIPFEEILALLKIVIGTRSFNKPEFAQLRNRLLSQLSKEDRDKAARLTNSTVAKYIPVKSKYNLLGRIKDFSDYIDDNLAIDYKYNSSTGILRQGLSLPVSIYFDTFYFYVIMYNEESNKSFPCRLDRFEEYHASRSKKIKLPQQLKKDDGSERNNTYLLNYGNSVHFELYFSGYPQTALDRFPNSKVKQTLDNEVLIEGNAYTQGLVLWIMGQGSRVRVKSPASLISAVKDELEKTIKYYE